MWDLESAVPSLQGRLGDHPPAAGKRCQKSLSYVQFAGSTATRPEKLNSQILEYVKLDGREWWTGKGMEGRVPSEKTFEYFGKMRPLF